CILPRCARRNSRENPGPTACARSPRSTAGTRPPPCRCRKEKEYRGRNTETAACGRSRRGPAGTVPKRAGCARAALRQRPGGCCCRPARTARAASPGRPHPLQTVREYVVVRHRLAGRVRIKASGILACFDQVGFPDLDRGVLRSSLRSERALAALLIADPDGFFNPR